MLGFGCFDVFFDGEEGRTNPVEFAVGSESFVEAWLLLGFAWWERRRRHCDFLLISGNMRVGQEGGN